LSADAGFLFQTSFSLKFLRMQATFIMIFKKQNRLQNIKSVRCTMLSMRLHVHTCAADFIPGVSWPTGARVVSWSVSAVGVSATTSVVRGTLVDICIITDITGNLMIPAGKTLQLPLFHSRPKTYLFHKSFPPYTQFRPQD